MKRIVSYLLVIIMIISLTAIGASASAAGETSTEKAIDPSLEEGINYNYGINDHTYDKVAAEQCFLKAAEADNGEAYYYLGKLALRSDDDTRFETAMNFYEKAIDLGCALGLLGKGELYEYGCGVERDYEKAKGLYEEALADGCVEANSNLANISNSAHGVDRDCVLALDYYTKALESEEFGYAAAAPVCIGNLYMNGIGGIQIDYATAIDWYQKGIDKGSSDGLVAMGLMYKNGFGVERDYKKAMEYFEEAADMGNSSAMNNIGILYDSGTGVGWDTNTAERWYEKAACEGNSAAFYNLGNIYRNRDGDYKKAIKYYQKAIDAGNPGGYTCMGYTSYMQGNHIEEREWYEKGAEYGDSLCMYNLGYCYEYGDGVQQNKNTALEWYEKSAEAGYPTAMLKVACFRYGEYGSFFKIDKEEAWRLFSDAAVHGDSGAMGAIADYYNGHLYYDESSENDPELILKWLGHMLNISGDYDHYVQLANNVVNRQVNSGQVDRETANSILEYHKNHYILP